MNKIKTNPLASFLMGALTATWLLVVLYCLTIGPSLNPSSAGKTESSTEMTSTITQEKVTYNTDIKEWTLTAKSGEKYTFHTPSGFYSLSDAYLDEMGTYYGKELSSESIVVVGDSTSTSSVNTYINANLLSDVEAMLGQLYGDSFSAEDMSVSEALHYMQNGELPEEVPSNYKIEEIKEYTVNDVIFKAYAISYDMEYEADKTEDSSNKADTAAQHVEQVVCYSDTEDPVEIVITQMSYDKDAAISLLDEFLGQK